MGRPRLSVSPATLDSIRRLATKGLSRRKIAPAVGLTYIQVEKLCVRNNISGLPPGHDIFVPSPDEERRFRELIENQKIQHRKVAKMMGWTPKRVMRLCKRLKIRTQRTGPRGGPGHPEWKGGRNIDKNGYVLLYNPAHPNARGRYVLEHRLVMEQKLGRLLKRTEVVHHINGNKQDNRIENLELFSENGEHLRHELAGKCPKWTPEGKARILAEVRRAGRNRPFSLRPNVLARRQKIARLKARSDTTDQVSS